MNVTTNGIPRWAGITLVALATLLVFVVVFRLGSQASAGISLNDPVVWVEDGARGRILQINGSTQEVTAAVDVTESRTDRLVALPNDRDAVFLNKSSGQFAQIGAVNLEAVNQIETGLDTGQLEDARFLGEVDPDTEQLRSYVISAENVLIFGGDSAEPVNIPLPDGLGDVVTAPSGELLAVTAENDQVLISRPDALVLLAELPEPASETEEPVGLVRAGDSVYVIDSSRRTAQEVDLSSGALGGATSICGSLFNAQLGGNVLTDSSSAQRIVVHDGDGGVLSVVEPGRGSCNEISLPVSGDNFGPPVAVDNTAYLPNYETGQVVVVDLAGRTVTRTHSFTPIRDREFELEVFDGVVWANEPNGVRAAVISPTEILSISKQQRVRVLGVGEDGDDAVGGQGLDDEADGQRVFGEGGDLFEGFSRDDGTPVAGDALALADEGGAENVNQGNVEPVDNDQIANPLAELVDTPVVVEAVEVEGDENNLLANFTFSADVVVAGEEVRLADDSTGNPTQWNWDFGDGTGAEGPEVSKIWESEGIFTVTMLIANELGDEAVQTHDFTVVAPDVLLPPTADFTFPTNTIEVGEPLELTSTTTGEPDTLFWEFGDGTNAVGNSVSKIFNSAGVFEVTLTASNAQGSDSDTATITVVPGGSPPQAVIANLPTSIDAGQTITLTSESTNSPTSTQWDFDDGNGDTGTEVRYAWEEPGEYRITLTVSNAAGEDTTFRTIFVEPSVDLPVARFTESDLTVIAGESVSFADQSSNNPTSRLWEFGDGSTAEGANVDNTWSEPGQFTVTLTVTNEAGSDSTAKTVTVLPIPVDPPTARFRVQSLNVNVGELVNFIDTSLGDPTEWSWNFRDGAPIVDSTAQNPAHAFSEPGTFTVELTASNEGGSDTFTRTIVVNDPPDAAFGSSADELDVSFTDQSTNSPTSWAWTFGDGTTSSAQNPQKTYAEAGTYLVTLVASNDAGDSTPFRSSITVVERPTANFTFVVDGLTVQFTNRSTDGPTAFSWNFGDGITVADSRENPTYTFAASDTYEVVLTATNGAGSDTSRVPVTVRLAPPQASFSCTVVNAGVSCDAGTSSNTVNYAWSAPTAVDPGGVLGAGGQLATFTFSEGGDHRITLTAANAAGDTDLLTQTVTLNLPVPSITAINTVSNTSGTVVLSAAATNNPTSWTWSAAPDGTLIAGATTAAPTFSFPAPGRYVVSAVASNANGNSITASEVIDVQFPPVISQVSSTETSIGVVALSAVATNSPTAWRWSLPDSIEGSSTSATPTFTFAPFSAPATRTFSGTVTAANANGGTSQSVPFTVTVSATAPNLPPTVVVTSTDDAGNGTIRATATTSAGTISWSVSGPAFATPVTASGPSAEFTVPVNGTYTFTASATDSGLTGSDTAAVAVTSVPPAPTTTTTPPTTTTTTTTAAPTTTTTTTTAAPTPTTEPVTEVAGVVEEAPATTDDAPDDAEETPPVAPDPPAAGTDEE